MDGLKGFPNVVWLEPNERILAHLSASYRLGSDLIDGTFGALLGEAWDTQSER
jgi:hypothetical protein